jgi:hypothetical protein
MRTVSVGTHVPHVEVLFGTPLKEPRWYAGVTTHVGVIWVTLGRV